MAQILIADDDPVILLVLKDMLESEGHAVVVVENGLLAEQAMACWHFDLFICDIFMPEREGIEIISDLRKRRSQLPVLMISINPGYLRMAKMLGARDVLAKPIDAAEFRQRVARLLDSGDGQPKA
ncbi:MAG: response regulator [Gammaproteobacteria bacterium]|nr:response regulator [Gammaproteobacteria bacterium]